MKRKDPLEGPPVRDPIPASHDSLLSDVQHADEAFEEPEWARGLGLNEENVREAFLHVGDMFRNMPRGRHQLAADDSTPGKSEDGAKRGGMTLDSAGGTYSVSYTRGDATKNRSGGAQPTLTLRKVAASLEEVVKQVVSTIIAHGQRVLHSMR